MASKASPPPRCTPPAATDSGRVGGAGASDKNQGGVLELAAITPVLNAGFRAVLKEAARLGVLDPPYGRTPMPDPKKITEEDPTLGSLGEEEVDRGPGDDGFVGTSEADQESADSARGPISRAPDDRRAARDGNTNSAMRGSDIKGSLEKAAGNKNCSDYGSLVEEADDDDNDAKLLEYKYEYGFNPLVFLGEYLRRHSPAMIQARKDKLHADLMYLRQRAAKCLGREEALLELRELVAARRSGVVHGPVAGEVSDCGAIVWAKTFRPGQLVVELSRHQDFNTVGRQGVIKVDQGTECTGTVEFDNLEPNTTWYQRAYLHYPKKGFDGPSAGFYAIGKFKTLPARDGEHDGTIRFVAFSARGLGSKDAAIKHRHEIEATCAAVSAAKPDFCLILGEPVSSGRGGPLQTKSNVCEGFRELQEIATRVRALSRLFQEHGYLTASDIVSASTEEAKKRPSYKDKQVTTAGPTVTDHSVSSHREKGRRETSKKEGFLSSGEQSSGGDGDSIKHVSATLPYWPLRCPDARVSRRFGPNAEMFLVDVRSGALGEDQLEWVTEAVEESTRTWKVIACGVPVGLPDTSSQFTTDTASDREHAAAATIQASVRTRIASKAGGKMTSPDFLSQNDDDDDNDDDNDDNAGAPERVDAAIEGGGQVPDRGPGIGGGGTDGDGGDGGEGGENGDGSGGGSALRTSSSMAAVQIQGLVAKLHARGCKNVVLVTPAWSTHRALSFFGGHEDEGRFPIYELGCGGLFPLHPFGRKPAATVSTSACPHLEPTTLKMRDLSLGSGSETKGLVCSLSFGRRQQTVETEEGGEGDGRSDDLSFEIFDASGRRASRLTLVAVK